VCTLTAVPTAAGVRVAFNRDELRTRPAARPPAVARVGPRLAAFPTDPPSGGTWLAATDAGLVLAVLNVNPPHRPARAGRWSRGRVVPALLGAASPWDAVFAVERDLDPADFATFRLVAIDRDVVADFYWDGREAVIGSQLLAERPVLFTSSGLGDDRVAPAREALFERVMGVARSRWPAAQDAFHRHRWADRPELSVDMARADARTVSYAAVEVESGRARFRYRPAGEGAGPAPETVCELPLRAEARS
jgi:hypothetical protein